MRKEKIAVILLLVFLTVITATHILIGYNLYLKAANILFLIIAFSGAIKMLKKSKAQD